MTAPGDTYSQTVAALEARGVMPERPPGLSTTRRALERIGYFESEFYRKYLHDPARVIIVAGTNGKGSVCATLDALLAHAGERIGLYTSPHLVETTERVRVAGRDISRALFCEAYSIVDQVTADLGLSHFEMLTVMAVWACCVHDCVDRLILEVGLGGRWDATNAVPHGFCILTPIAMDHQNLLGDTVVEIAANKLDVVSDGAVVVHAPFPPGVVPTRPAGRWVPAEQGAASLDLTTGEPRWLMRSRYGTAAVVLPGRRGVENTLLALTAFEQLGFQPSEHLGALASVRWPGRMQRVPDLASCPVYVSGDHNPAGVESLVELLSAWPRRRLHVVVGIGRDKDADAMLAQLARLPDADLYLTTTPVRPRPLAAYGEWRARAVGAWDVPRAALDAARQRATPGDLIVVTGSLYLVGQVLADR